MWARLRSRWGRRRRGTGDRDSANESRLDEWTVSVSGHRFADRALLGLAMSHRSWCAENRGAESNERLEFLGDSILQWVVTELIFQAHPGFSEGELTDLRKSLVNAETLAVIAGEIGLGRWIRLGAGEDAAGGRQKVSILADALEAYIGALYIDAGADKARDFVVRIMGDRPLDQVNRLMEFDARSHLIRVCVREYTRPPVLEISSVGAAHEPTFTARVVVNGESIAEASGRTKKSAAQAASTEALAVLVSRGVDTNRA